jgi:hypothetical protein
MPFARLYLPFIESEYKVGKGLVKPRNIYKIQSYEYKDGTVKTMTGVKSSYVFVIGIYNKQLTCVKFSQVTPEIFKIWFKDLFKRGLKEKEIDEAKELSELLHKGTRSGGSFFSSYIKSETIYKGKIPTYRTYLLDNINQIKVVNLKKDFIKALLNITPTPPSEQTDTQ